MHFDVDAWREAFDETLEPLYFSIGGARFRCRPREPLAVLVLRDGMTRESVGRYLLAVVDDSERDRLRGVLDADPPPDGEMLLGVVVWLVEQYASSDRQLDGRRFDLAPFVTSPQDERDAELDARHLAHIEATADALAARAEA